MEKESLVPKQPLLMHLAELRYRFIAVLLWVAVGSVAAYFFSDHLLSWLASPLKRPLVFFAPMEAFMVRVKLAIFGGVMLTLPFTLFHVWRFLAPGMTGKERWLALFMAPLLTLFFLGGVTFAYFLVLPAGLQVLLSFGSHELQPLISIESYFSFVTLMLLAFGVTFELPPVLFTLSRLGVVTSRQLSKVRPYAVLLIFIAGAVLTPTPDIVNQLLLVIPLWILYEVTLLVIRLTGK